jgi:phenylalanine-4-hydroxylase
MLHLLNLIIEDMGNPSGYSPVVSEDGAVRVELDEDHPGFADPVYRARRNEIATLSVGHRPGNAIPQVEYTDREHDVWRVVASELEPKHRKYGCREFVEAAEQLQLPNDHIPQLGEVTARLRPITGFDYEPVAGLAPVRDFYGAFASRMFFSTQYIRHHSVPLYTPEPDIVHEVIGHANQLANPVFADIYEEVGKAVARTDSKEALGFLSRKGSRRHTAPASFPRSASSTSSRRRRYARSTSTRWARWNTTSPTTSRFSTRPDHLANWPSD